MILLLGASGYVGQAFAGELRRRGYDFAPLTRRAIDYAHFDILFDYIRRMRPEFLINAAGCIGKPDMNACELAREEALSANTLLPQTIARVCLMTNTPWGHVSSGYIFSGAKVVENEKVRIERNLNRPEMRRRLVECPETIFGFTEQDEPNFSFRRLPCNFYSGTKALAEEVIHGIGQSYIWRPGCPFDEREAPRNFLQEIQQHPRLHDGVNSMSQVEDFVRACLNLWERQAPFGIYNVANPGIVTTRQVADMIQRILKPNRRFEFWKNDEEFYRWEARAPRSNSILDVSKLLAAGMEMRPVEDALEDSLRNWHSVVSFGELARY
jgi:dTDP-4-dehydrorhamnose reductase